VEVGGKNFFVHKDAISSTSAILKKEVNSDMKEKNTKTIKLEDTADDWLSFGLFLQFSYFGSYGYDENSKDDSLAVHASVYVLSEKIEALELKSLALRKATALCASASVAKNAENGLVKVLQFVLPETVKIIYDGTYDNNTGKPPCSLVEFDGSSTTNIQTPATIRDGFRMLLAKFAASYIGDLRKNQSFIAVLEEIPAFGADVLLFTIAGTQMVIDGLGNLQLE